MSVRKLNLPSQDLAVRFPEVFSMQIAVLWTDRSVPGLGLIHSLREMGLPFFVTYSVSQAITHRILIIYPLVDYRSLSVADASRLFVYVRNGGVIFADNVFWGGLRELFGFTDYEPARSRHWVIFDSGSEPALKYLTQPEEQRLPLGSPTIPQVIWTNGYQVTPGVKILARFEDGLVAMSCNQLGMGRAYLLGVSLDDAVLRNQANRDFEAERAYVNAFEPGSDVWMLILRALYENVQPNWIRLGTIPNGKRSILLLSHDLDWVESVGIGLRFAAMERQHHDLSTYFVQTKYYGNAFGPAILSAQNLHDIEQLQADGFDIESHSVMHALSFNHFPLGNGTEHYPQYHPTLGWFDQSTYHHASVFGELVVSKSILDGNLPGHDTVFFRAGHLRVPFSLPEALKRAGYRYDSSFTAADVLTNFPYDLPVGLGEKQDSGIYEFPVTIEDEQKPPLSQRLDTALRLIDLNAANGAISVILIHPSDLEKMQAEQQLLDRLPADIAVADMLSYARFWSGRALLDWRVLGTARPESVTLRLVATERVQDLTFEFARRIAFATGLRGARLNGHDLIVPSLPPKRPLTIEIHYAS
ncbi:MAG: hypothetical protein JO166_02525 [Deltaproteobacteria bacterium]|nr:hypothetical protein [Deltaproteobacteria bacterium]